MTEWRTIPTFPDYEASSDGAIRRSTGYNSTLAGRVMKPRIINGYATVTIKASRRYVHRLVCEAFNGVAVAMQAAHLDGDRTNNRATNLAWVTQVDNERHKTAHGTRKVGASVSNAKLTDVDVRTIRDAVDAGVEKTSLAVKYGVHPTLIKRIAVRKAWRHVS